jgi:hypothetical protein
MTDYLSEKRKRKNDEGAGTLASVGSFIGSILKGFWQYFIYLPVKIALEITFKILKWVWNFGLGAVMWLVKAPFRAVGWVWHFFFAEVTPPIENYRQMVYWYSRRRMRQRNRFITHAFIYTAGLMAIALYWYNTYQAFERFGGNLGQVNEASLLMLVLWTLPLAFHFARLHIIQSEDNTLMRTLKQEHLHELEMQRLQSQNSHYYDHLTTEYADEVDDYDEKNVPVAKTKRQ